MFYLHGQHKEDRRAELEIFDAMFARITHSLYMANSGKDAPPAKPEDFLVLKPIAANNRRIYGPEIPDRKLTPEEKEALRKQILEAANNERGMMSAWTEAVAERKRNLQKQLGREE